MHRIRHLPTNSLRFSSLNARASSLRESRRGQTEQVLPAEARQVSGMETKPIWLDCDPGHDDALAIILAGLSIPHFFLPTHALPGSAAYHPKAELLGVSTVFGNQSLEKVTKNAHFVLHAAGVDSIGVSFLCRAVTMPCCGMDFRCVCWAASASDASELLRRSDSWKEWPRWVRYERRSSDFGRFEIRNLSES